MQGAEHKVIMLRQQQQAAAEALKRIERERAELSEQAARLEEKRAAAAEKEAALTGEIAGSGARSCKRSKQPCRRMTPACSADERAAGTARGAPAGAGRAVHRAERAVAGERPARESGEALGKPGCGVGRAGGEAGKGKKRRYGQRGQAAEARAAERKALLAQRVEKSVARQAAGDTLTARRKEEAALREELAGLRARQRTLSELEETHEGFFPGVRAVLAAAENGKLAGCFAPVSALLTVPAELETAIETALGADLQNIVTETESAARAAIELLKSGKAGRATFLPLDILSPSPEIRRAEFPGIRGRADTLVQFDEKYARAIRHLLGRVLIAENLESALAAAKSGAITGWSRIVTLDGEMVHPHHAITGGLAGKGAGLLRRRRELEEAGEAMAAAERELAKRQQAASKAAEEVTRLEGEISALGKEADRAASALVEAEHAVAVRQREATAIQ